MEVLSSAVGEYGLKLLENFPLQRIAKIGTKGKARLYCKVYERESLKRLLRFLLKEGISYTLCGYSFNTIWGDGFYDGMVIDLTGLKGKKYNGLLVVEAGCSINETLKLCEDLGLSGLEELSGVPGSIGASVVGNAGAFGRSMGELVEWVEVFDPLEGQFLRLGSGDIDFGYRFSSLVGYAVISVALKLTESDKSKVHLKIEEILDKRKGKFPSGNSLGCVFKNPTGHFAGRLIEEVGLKGYRCGKAFVSRIHANFIISEKGAEAKDYVNVINSIKRSVLLAKGVKLEEEIRYAGSFV